MNPKRFSYCHSHIYGWCVCDAERQHSPAYDACCELLPLKDSKECPGTKVAESPVLLKSEYQAMSLCTKLNVAWKRSQKAL